MAFKAGLPAEYEPTRFAYVKKGHYLPDWRIAPDVYIETKGYLSPSNRSNLIAFKEQHPKVTILLLFQNSRNKLNSKSKTTYGEWATKHGIPWWDIKDGLPKHWWTNLGKQQEQNDHQTHES